MSWTGAGLERSVKSSFFASLPAGSFSAAFVDQILAICEHGIESETGDRPADTRSVILESAQLAIAPLNVPPSTSDTLHGGNACAASIDRSTAGMSPTNNWLPPSEDRENLYRPSCLICR